MADCQLSALRGKLDEYNNKVRQMIDDRMDELKKEIKFYEKSKNLKSGIGDINNVIGGITDLTENIDGLDMLGKIDAILRTIFNISSATKFFGGSLDNRFSSLNSWLSSMLLTDKETVFKLIDYMRKAMILRINDSLQELVDLKYFVELFRDRYNTFDTSVLNTFMSTYLETLKSALAATKLAEEDIKIIEYILANDGILSAHHRDTAISDLDKAINILNSDGQLSELSFIYETKRKIDEKYNDVMSMLGYINSFKTGAQTLDDQLVGLNILNTAGLDIVVKAKTLIAQVIESISYSIELLIKSSDTDSNSLMATWIGQLETLKGMIKYLDQDFELDTESPRYEEANLMAIEFKNFDVQTETDYLKNDVNILGTILERTINGNGVEDITALTNRIISNIDSINTKIVAIRDFMQSQLPETSDRKINDFLRNVREHGFDNWIRALLNGDILGFLSMLFSNSSTAGMIIKTLRELQSCGFNSQKYSDLLSGYFEGIRDQSEKKLKGIVDIDQFKDIVPKNLKKKLEGQKRIKQETQNGVNKAKAEI